MASTDAARVLRPPGSLNHKSRPPRVVETVTTWGEIYTLERLVGQLDDPPEPRRSSRGRTFADDPLLGISPIEYVEELLGERVGANGKVTCPFHSDWVPSLHIYDSPEDGWFCFQCERGGDIFNLAADLAGVPARGDHFKAIRDYLVRKFL